MQLIHLLLNDPYSHYLLVVGSYRAEALSEAHPLRQLSPQAMSILQTAACVGVRFELDTVAQLCPMSHGERSEALAEAVRAGFLLSTDSASYLTGPVLTSQEGGDAPATSGELAVVFKFLHERVQQSIYATLDTVQREDCHLRLGKLRLAQWGQDAPAGRLFDLVNHLNLGSPRMRDSGDVPGLLALAKLNLSAGQRAKATAAFHAAVGFFTAGTSLFPESAWSDHHELLFKLHLELAHSESLNGGFPEAEARLLALRKRARSTVEHGLVCLRLCELYYARADFATSTRVGLEGLLQIGMTMPPPEEAIAAFMAERAEIDRALAGRAIADLVHLPLNQSPEIDVTVQLIVALASPAYIVGSPCIRCSWRGKSPSRCATAYASRPATPVPPTPSCSPPSWGSLWSPTNSGRWRWP